MMLGQKIIALILLVQVAFGQENTGCETKETCSECIQNLNCIWCNSPISQNGSAEDLYHCMEKRKFELNTNWCPQAKLVSPTSFFSILERQPLNTDGIGPAIQISPQRFKMSLRRGEEINFRFQYAQAKDYPVDLYYIMDLSASMETHRRKLGALGLKLARTMRNITTDFRIGFGSFVDKVALPFASTSPEKLKSPCSLNKPDGTRISCVPPYSFKNHLSLTSSYETFATNVEDARVSGNLDAPEGGFDAIMQAMVCKDEIKWRDQARHILVYSTDAEFHIAGDGKLAGVVEPNDGKCHMQNHEYVDFLKYDYPSISQINYVAKENNINLVFAIVKNKLDALKHYRALSQNVENSNTGGLDDDSQNVIQLVVDNYNRIVDTVTLRTNATRDIEVKFSSDCPSPKENGCSNVHVGQIVEFIATIKLLDCPKAAPKTRYISIRPESLDESIVIELETLCDCDCEHDGSADFISNSPDCSKMGNLECGVCKCHKGYFGKNCECDSSSSTTDDESACINESTGEVCSNLGSCQCGKCQCKKRKDTTEQIYGKYCQCDNYSCKREAGVLCSGRGSCECGNCMCDSGWNGDACQCPNSNSSCISLTGDGQVCSGHGRCQCGKCECNEDDHRYSGKFCEECPSCPGQRCKELKDCVECQAYQSGKYDKIDCSLKCTAFVTEVVENINEYYLEENAKICQIPVDGNCYFNFKYFYAPNKILVVQAQKEKICPKPVAVWSSRQILKWVIGVIVTVILAGLIMAIIWKVVTEIHDRKEYAKFISEQSHRKWHVDDNPLYRGATTTFNNPAYNNRSGRFSFRHSKAISPPQSP